MPPWAQRAAALGLRVVETLPDSLSADTISLVSAALSREFSVVPLGRGSDGRLTLAAASAQNALQRRHELEFALGPVEIVAAEPSAVHGLLARHYAAQSIPILTEPELAGTGFKADDLPSETLARLPGIASYVDSVLSYAARLGASDVHFEPAGDVFRVRMRVDGALRTLPQLPASAGPAVLARLKVLSGLDLAQSRRAQDGRIRCKGFDTIELRLATLPTISGECAVLCGAEHPDSHRAGACRSCFQSG